MFFLCLPEDTPAGVPRCMATLSVRHGTMPSAADTQRS